MIAVWASILFAGILFAGLPVAPTLAAVGFALALLGYALDLMPIVALLNLPLRMYANLGENLIYPAVPMSHRHALREDPGKLPRAHQARCCPNLAAGL